jgi:hypothetical protein
MARIAAAAAVGSLACAAVRIAVDGAATHAVLAVSGTAFAIAYAGALLALDVPTERERSMMRGLMPGRLRLS